MADDPKDPPSLEEIAKSPVEPTTPGEEQFHGSGMTHRDGPSERVRFMEQEREEAWQKWASDHGASDRSKDGADYSSFIESYYELAARGQGSPPALEEFGKPPAEPSGPGRDMGELAAREPPQAPSLGDLGKPPGVPSAPVRDMGEMTGQAPADVPAPTEKDLGTLSPGWEKPVITETVKEIGDLAYQQGVRGPDRDREPGE